MPGHNIHMPQRAYTSVAAIFEALEILGGHHSSTAGNSLSPVCGFGMTPILRLTSCIGRQVLRQIIIVTELAIHKNEG